MGEKLEEIRARFNGSFRIESRPERLSGEAGGSILREIIALNRAGEDAADTSDHSGGRGQEPSTAVANTLLCHGKPHTMI